MWLPSITYRMPTNSVLFYKNNRHRAHTTSYPIKLSIIYVNINHYQWLYAYPLIHWIIIRNSAWKSITYLTYSYIFTKFHVYICCLLRLNLWVLQKSIFTFRLNITVALQTDAQVVTLSFHAHTHTHTRHYCSLNINNYRCRVVNIKYV